MPVRICSMSVRLFELHPEFKKIVKKKLCTGFFSNYFILMGVGILKILGEKDFYSGNKINLGKSAFGIVKIQLWKYNFVENG